MSRRYYFYRNNVIEHLDKGWLWVEESCRGKSTGIPVYKTIEDARNAIRKYHDGTHKAEPRIAYTLGFEIGKGYYPEKEA